MDAPPADELIRELLHNPGKFDEEGRAYILLQHYFAGLSLDTLRPLLRSNNVLVQQAAGFIASELGSKASSLIDDVIPLLSSTDAYNQWYAMDVLVVSAIGEKAESFAHLLRMLESETEVIRGQAMVLVARADTAQLEASKRVIGRGGSRLDAHRESLQALATAHRLDPNVIAGMMQSSDDVTRRYAAIAAYRVRREHPGLMAQAATSEDPEIRKFHETMSR